MLIEILQNPNTSQSGFFAFEELAQPQPIRALKLQTGNVEEVWDVIGVEEGGKWIKARAQKVSDSGAAFGFLIYGGAWGIRMKRSNDSSEWDLKDSNQKGEAYLVYADEAGLVYA